MRKSRSVPARVSESSKQRPTHPPPPLLSPPTHLQERLLPRVREELEAFEALTLDCIDRLEAEVDKRVCSYVCV